MRICIVEGCGKKYWASGYCRYHVEMFYHRGEIVTRNRLSPNEIIINDNNCEIVLYNTLGYEVGRTILDLQDKPLVENHKWYLDNSGYATTRISRNKQMRMHNILIPRENGKEIDHVDRNPLNNKRSNLRLCSHMENMWNAKRKNNKYGCVGIRPICDGNKWQATITSNYKRYHLGTFKTKEEAIKARTIKEIELHKHLIEKE